MKYTKLSALTLASGMLLFSCNEAPKDEATSEDVKSTTVIEVEDDFQ